jgi:rhodanese-related sulfurtransferase
MSPSGAELLRKVKSQIDEVDPAEVAELIDEGVAVVDVREAEEYAISHLPGAKHVPRSYLESRIEGVVPDRSTQVILYCASGNRSAYAARTLKDELGYTHVRSMTGGITLWKDRGYEVEATRPLTPEQRERYSRHLLIPEIGVEGQQKLLDAKVLLLGAGGLGSPTALYLAAAGVGTLGIVDDDEVDLSNLQRQVIHSTQRIGIPKVDSAEESIHALNPAVEVVKYQTRIDASNIMEIIEGYDVIVDGVDNFPTRYLLNDATVRLKIPVVSASILGFDGQLSVFKPYAAVRRAGRDTDRGQGPPRPRLPDLLARPRSDHRRGDGLLPRLRGVLRRRRVAYAGGRGFFCTRARGARGLLIIPRWRQSRSPRSCEPRSVARSR